MKTSQKANCNNAINNRNANCNNAINNRNEKNMNVQKEKIFVSHIYFNKNSNNLLSYAV